LDPLIFGAKMAHCIGWIQLFLAPKWSPAVEGESAYFGAKMGQYCGGQI
jgi:hypothetical protein